MEREARRPARSPRTAGAFVSSDDSSTILLTPARLAASTKWIVPWWVGVGVGVGWRERARELENMKAQPPAATEHLTKPMRAKRTHYHHRHHRPHLLVDLPKALWVEPRVTSAADNCFRVPDGCGDGPALSAHWAGGRVSAGERGRPQPTAGCLNRKKQPATSNQHGRSNRWVVDHRKARAAHHA